MSLDGLQRKLWKKQHFSWKFQLHMVLCDEKLKNALIFPSLYIWSIIRFALQSASFRDVPYFRFFYWLECFVKVGQLPTRVIACIPPCSHKVWMGSDENCWRGSVLKTCRIGNLATCIERPQTKLKESGIKTNLHIYICTVGPRWQMFVSFTPRSAVSITITPPPHTHTHTHR